MNPLSAQFSTFAVTAFLVYLVLRAVGSRREGNQLAMARRHALWCAVIAFFASSSSDWFDTFYQIPNDPDTVYGFWTALGTAATPAAWLAFAYIAGQFTWPRHLKPQRSASLTARSLTGLIPRPLLALLVLASVAAGAAMWAVRDVTGLAPQPERIIDREDYWAQYPQQYGFRAAPEVLPVVAASLGFIVLTVILVTILVLYRKPLPGISDHDNRLLRKTWLNRLYRTAIYLVVVTAGSLLHYKARWLYRQADLYTDSTPGFDHERYEQMLAGAGPWDDVANYAVMGVALLMLFWRPPSSFQGLPAARANPTGRLRDQLYSAHFLTTALLFLLMGVFGWTVTEELDYQDMPSAAHAERIMLFCAAAALFYLAANAAIMAYTSSRSRSAASLPRHHRPLPRWIYLVAAILVLASTFVLLNPPLDYLWGMVPARPMVVAPLVLLVLLGYLGFRQYTRRTVIPWDVTKEHEIWYRRVLELRALRAVVAALVAMPLVAYPFPPGSVAFALLIFFLPSALMLERPALQHLVPAGGGNEQ